MKAPFSLFLALRYLKPKRTFVSIITLISILGVTLGITVLIVVISVMTGFDQELRKKVLGFDAHVLVTNDSVMKDWRELDAEIERTEGVVASAPFVQGPVIVEFEGKRLAPKIRGIEVEREERVTDIRSAVKWGELDLEGDKTVIGKELADQLGVQIGEKAHRVLAGKHERDHRGTERRRARPGEQKNNERAPRDGAAPGTHRHGCFRIRPLHL